LIRKRITMVRLSKSMSTVEQCQDQRPGSRFNFQLLRCTLRGNRMSRDSSGYGNTTSPLGSGVLLLFAS